MYSYMYSMFSRYQYHSIELAAAVQLAHTKLLLPALLNREHEKNAQSKTLKETSRCVHVHTVFLCVCVSVCTVCLCVCVTWVSAGGHQVSEGSHNPLQQTMALHQHSTLCVCVCE